MTFRDMLSMSVGNLWRRKLRTFLTVLGVLIGTTSIVAMLSIGIGMKQTLMEQYSNYGSATQVEVYTTGENGNSLDYLLTDSNMEKMSQLEHVKEVNPVLNLELSLAQKKYSSWGTLYGVSQSVLEGYGLAKGDLPSADAAGKLEILAGNMTLVQFYDQSNSEGYYDTGVLPDVDLFSNALKLKIYNDNAEAPADEEGDYSYDYYYSPVKGKITGLMEGEVEEYKGEYSYCYLTNIDALKKYLTKNFKKGQIPGQPKDGNGKPYKEWIYSKFTVEVDESSNVEEVQKAIQEMGFEASSNRELLESTQATFKIVELVLGGIGMVAFLVAAIGIANTMMMSTYERTKEIGVMKVLGCDMKDIMGLFLSEAGFIGFLGGIIGIVLSEGVSFGLNIVLADFMANEMGTTGGRLSVIPWWLVIVAIIFSTFMGMVAGFFPARRAMNLSPLAAIRNE